MSTRSEACASDTRFRALLQAVEVVYWRERGLQLLAQTAETLNASQKHGREDNEDNRASKRARMDQDVEVEADAGEVTEVDTNANGDKEFEWSERAFLASVISPCTVNDGRTL